MDKLYLLPVRIILLMSFVLALNIGAVIAMDGKVDTAKSKLTDTRVKKPALRSESVKIKTNAASLANLNTISGGQEPKNILEDKILNVKIYPIPVLDKINVTYHLSKDSNVIIQVMNFLGSKVVTLLAKKVSAGDQSNNFSISSKLNSGAYFVQVIVDQKTVTKRILVL